MPFVDKILQTALVYGKEFVYSKYFLIFCHHANSGCKSFIFRFKTNKRKTRRIGKIVAASSPVFRLPPASSERLPTIAGLTVLPKSPANAKTANMAVPPCGHFREERLIVPGHIMPTLKPQRAQPARPRIGKGEREASR